MEQPSDSQREVIRQLVQHAEDLTGVLQGQFANCLTAPEEHCDQCFDITVTSGAPLLPQGIDYPLTFSAASGDETGGGDVLVWHEEGQITGVEISWYEDAHPPLTDVRIFHRSRGAY